MNSDNGAAPAADGSPRPAQLCRALLDALDATEGRRRRRKRNTSADAIGIAMKRVLLESAVRDDPEPAEFEGWLLEQCFAQGPGEGAWRAMAVAIFDEWRMASAAPSFRAWLEAGAPSDDKPARSSASLPVLLVACVFIAGCQHGVEEAEVDDKPSIDVVPMQPEEAQRSGMYRPVLEPLGAGEDAEVIYEPPVELARPPGVAVWPPLRLPREE